ncbi:hypothetical protein ABT136_14725 [Streptomyces sp. NPDC001856]|uniref:hypothetical protein n=1 Tax=Streptomyces sp. NPDC001856 TaxID=3154399 RepID=UPI00331865AC
MAGAEDAGREAEGVDGPEGVKEPEAEGVEGSEGVEEPEAELLGSGAPDVEEEAAELTAPDGVTPPSVVSAPPPPG